MSPLSHLPFSLKSIISRFQPQQNFETDPLKANSDLPAVISKGQFSGFLCNFSVAVNMADHCLLLELSLLGLCSANILKISQALESGRYKHKFWISTLYLLDFSQIIKALWASIFIFL